MSDYIMQMHNNTNVQKNVSVIVLPITSKISDHFYKNRTLSSKTQRSLLLKLMLSSVIIEDNLL